MKATPKACRSNPRLPRSYLTCRNYRTDSNIAFLAASWCCAMGPPTSSSTTFRMPFLLAKNDCIEKDAVFAAAVCNRKCLSGSQSAFGHQTAPATWVGALRRHRRQWHGGYGAIRGRKGDGGRSGISDVRVANNPPTHDVRRTALYVHD